MGGSRPWVVGRLTLTLSLVLAHSLLAGCQSEMPDQVAPTENPGESTPSVSSAAKEVFSAAQIRDTEAGEIRAMRYWSVLLLSGEPTPEQVAEMLLAMHESLEDKGTVMRLSLIYPSETGLGLGIDVYWNASETTLTAPLQDVGPTSMLVGRSKRDRLAFDAMSVGDITERRTGMSKGTVEDIANGVSEGEWLTP